GRRARARDRRRAAASPPRLLGWRSVLRLSREDEYVLVGDQEHALEGAAALVVELEEARPRHERAVAQAAEERHPPCLEGEPGAGGKADDLVGQVDELPVGAVGAGGED